MQSKEKFAAKGPQALSIQCRSVIDDSPDPFCGPSKFSSRGMASLDFVSMFPVVLRPRGKVLPKFYHLHSLQPGFFFFNRLTESGAWCEIPAHKESYRCEESVKRSATEV